MSATYAATCEISKPKRREALLIDLYRRGRLSHLALAQVLGIDRFEVEELLQKHNVTEDLGTTADYLRDASVLEQLRRRPS